MRALLLVLAAMSLLGLGGCTISTGVPGVPDVEFEVPDSAGQAACKQFAQAIINNTTREGMTADVDAARATAATDPADPEAQRVAAAIQEFLFSIVAGTPESFEAATNEVIASCRNAGVNISVE